MTPSTMESLVDQATEHLENAHVERAYHVYLKALVAATQTLQNARFNENQLLVTPPETLLSVAALAHTCLTSTEEIIRQYPWKPKPPVPPKPASHRARPIPPSRPNRGKNDMRAQEENDDAPRGMTFPTARGRQNTCTKTSGRSAQMIHRQASAPALHDQHQEHAHALSLAAPIDSIPWLARRPSEDLLCPWPMRMTVDPTHRVAVQRSGDSFSSFSSAEPLPSIPCSPLQATYEMLQERLTELESQSKSPMVIRQMTDTKTTCSWLRHLHMLASTVASVLQLSPFLVAYQLTLIDAHIFYQIPSAALGQHSPKSPHPAIVASTDFFNYLTRVIEHSVLTPSEASGRAQLIHYWVKVACTCLELRNYQTLKAIVSALGTPPIQRLKRSWAFVPKKSLVRLAELTEFMSETCNYKCYRERLQHSTEHTLPFLGTFIHDMTYLAALPSPPTPPSPLHHTFRSTTGRSATKDTRLMDLLKSFERFQHCAPYPTLLPSELASRVNKTRRRKLSYALGMKKIPPPDDIHSTDLTMDMQQCVVTHFLLSRSWVTETMVDELSLLREPPKTIRSNSVAEPLSSTLSLPSQVSTNSGFYDSCCHLSLAASSGDSGDSGDSRPVSIEDDDDMVDPDLRTSAWSLAQKCSTPALDDDPDSQATTRSNGSSNQQTFLYYLSPPPFFRKDFWRPTNAGTGSERSSLETTWDDDLTTKGPLSPTEDLRLHPTSPLPSSDRSTAPGINALSPTPACFRPLPPTPSVPDVAWTPTHTHHKPLQTF